MTQPGLAMAIIIAGIAIAVAIVFTNPLTITVDADITETPISGPVLDDVITIGLIPVEKGQEPESEASALKEFLQDELGVKVEITYTTGYEPLIEGMRFGHLDAAFMDTGPAWITHQRTGAEVVLAELVNGKVNYQATVWALEDNDSIKSLGDTVGKKVAFTSITGSSGFIRPVGTLVAEDYIEIKGDDIVSLEEALEENFESYTFAGGYKTALELLLEGHVDAAFGSDIAPQKYLEPEDQTRLRAVSTIGPVPSHVFMVHPDMSDPTREALVAALIKLNYDENNQILIDLYGAEALVPTTTRQHIGDFGSLIDNLTGLDQKILDKYDKSK
ncbi:MAG: phosphate/phosphite/phosphonate ABC transporter substrate-binding protein [Nitrosopumilus sp. B06]|nr:MAG: phosphate/phosphite/phosphonate ABC transporter substrate-binding protein [Nitrosopumilus sp. B06]